MGGGGFQMEPENHAAGRSRPRPGPRAIRSRPAAHLPHPDRDVGRSGADRLVRGAVRGATGGAGGAPAVRPPGRPRIARSRPGRRVRDGREHRQPPRAVAAARVGPRPPPGVGGRDRAGRHVGRGDLLVRVLYDGFLRPDASAAPRRPRVPRRQPEPALPRRGPAAAALSPPCRRRHAAGGLRGRRRRGARLRGSGTPRGRDLRPGRGRLAGRARRRRGRDRDALPTRFLGA